MADGVAITAGSGTTVLTDDTGAGGHAQVMKLAISTDGSGTLIPAEATNGLDVDVTRVQGTVTVQDSEKIADNAGFTDGTTMVLPVGYVFDDVAGTALTENDIGAARIDSKRAVVSVIEDGTTRGRKATVGVTGLLAIENFHGGSLSSASNGTVAAGTQRVTIASDSTGNIATIGTSVTPGTAATNLGKAEDAASANGDVGVAAMAVRKGTPANTSDTDGDYEMLQMAAGRLWTSTAVDTALPAGTNAIGKLAANSGVDIGDVDVTSVSGTVTVGGVAATDAAVAGNPVLAAGRSSTVKPTAVSADGDVVPLWLSPSGATVTTPLFGLTSTLANVAGSATSVTLLAANTGRRSGVVVNDGAAILYVKEGATASTTSYTYKLQPDDTLILDGAYSGIIDGIWSSATGAARITERT